MKTIKPRLFTAKDISATYPWISPWVANSRIKNSHQEIRYPSTGQGIPNMWTFDEVVHAGVIDEFSTLGVFAHQLTTAVSYWEPDLDDHERPVVTLSGGGLEKPTRVKEGFYERYNYKVIIEVEVRHDFLPGSNIPPDIREGPGRFSRVTYAPEKSAGKVFMDAMLSYWLNPKKKKFNKAVTTKCFLKVEPLYELAKEKLL